MAVDGLVATEPATDLRAMADQVAAAARAAAKHGRDDLARRLVEVGGRLTRAETTVCIVGEFKQGKSALVNALLGSDICPVDDDLATTAVTVVRHGRQRGITVRRREGTARVTEEVGPDEIAAWVSERENPENRRNVELVEVALPDRFLERGIVLVDTPGVGGLNAAHAAATLAFLPAADALVFVTDASAELSAAELEFLVRARDACPVVLVALTKIDLYPEWRRILAIDTERLAGIDLAFAPFPVSSALLGAARRLGDDALEAESGVAPLAEAIRVHVIERAAAGAAARARREVSDVLDQLRVPLAHEFEALEGHARARELAEDLRATRGRLDALAGTGARWSVRLDDEFEALGARLEFSFHGGLRGILREAQEELERTDPGRTWPDFSARLQGRVAEIVQAAFVDTAAGARQVHRTIARMLSDEDVEVGAGTETAAFDVAGLWQGGDLFEGGARRRLGGTFGLLTGAYVGIDMLGVFGALLGTAIVGPALLGGALFFGGRQVAEERRRRLIDRRQAARTFVGQFIENVQFEIDGRLRSLTADLRARMSSAFGDRIEELRRTHAESAAALERALEQDDAERSRRLPTLRAELAELDALVAQVSGLPSRA